MNLLWPGFLLLLGILPLVIGIYIWMLRRRKRYTVRYSSLALIREALPHQSRLRRHLPFALFLLALASLIFAVGRPVATVLIPDGQVSVILAIDVSRSMLQNDIPPNRIMAAQDAALSFIRRQQAGTQIGIVAFAGFAELIQPPTDDQAALEAAVRSLTTARRTAVGSAILASLDAIADFNPNVAPVSRDLGLGSIPNTGQEDTYMPDIIVLLTDGASNTGPLPLDAAMLAMDRQVRVYTIGFGTLTGEGGFGGNDNPFGNNDRGNDQMFQGFFRRGLDEETLKAVADMTGGTYYAATSANELHEVFAQLPNYAVTREETTELSVIFSAAGALLAALAVVLALLWNPLP
jgi:Ca-activated chloride channel family protein